MAAAQEAPRIEAPQAIRHASGRFAGNRHVSTLLRPHALALLLVTVTASFAVIAQPGSGPAAESWALCRQDPLLDFYKVPTSDGSDRLAAPALVSARRFDVADRRFYSLQGEVLVERADQRLEAGQLRFDAVENAFVASDAVRYQDRDLLLAAATASGDLDIDRVEVGAIRYQLLSARGNGSADSALLVGETSALQQVTYSTCDPQERSWELAARRIDLDHAEGIGRARGATLRLGRVPVLYLPYVTFPIDERRRTGFLYPAFGHSDNTGIDVRIPYYLNLAPNYDATLTARLMSQRGVMLGGEFRYLGANHRGELSGSLLPDDDETGDDRGSLTWLHAGRLSPHWTVGANLNHVSDDRYFEDFGDSLAASSTSLLESSAGLYGRGVYWNASVAVQAWDVTDPFVADVLEPFRRLPRGLFRWEQPLGEWLRAGVHAEAVAFEHEERPGGERVDLYPYLSLPVERAGWFLRPELGYRYTAYQLDREWLDGPAGSFPERSPDRGTEILSVDTGAIFERELDFFGRPSLQTLEPRLYYLYVPFEDQGDLPVFDTQELTFGLAQLFRTNRFSGADRQTDANQATLAVSSRIYDEATGRERMALTLGQIRYFDDQDVELPGVPERDRNASAYVAEADLRLAERWSLGASQQWDPLDDHTTLSALRAQYRFGRGGVANLSYRYRRAILEQVDGSVLAPLNAWWRLIGRWNYSLRDESTIEAFAGVEYEGCCYALRILGRHYVRNREGEKNNALYVELELKGLGSVGRRTEELLQRAILGYER